MFGLGLKGDFWGIEWRAIEKIYWKPCAGTFETQNEQARELRKHYFTQQRHPIFAMRKHHCITKYNLTKPKIGSNQVLCTKMNFSNFYTQCTTKFDHLYILSDVPNSRYCTTKYTDGMAHTKKKKYSTDHFSLMKDARSTSRYNQCQQTGNASLKPGLKPAFCKRLAPKAAFPLCIMATNSM